MDTLIWSREVDPYEGHREPLGQGCGCALGVVSGLLAAVILGFAVGLAWWWCAAVWLAAVVAGTSIGRRAGRAAFQVRRLEITPSEVRVVRPKRTRVVDLARVRAVSVLHRDDAAGARLTTLSVTYATSGRSTNSVSVTRRHDPGLAGRLTALLGFQITVAETSTGPV